MSSSATNECKFERSVLHISIRQVLAEGAAAAHEKWAEQVGLGFSSVSAQNLKSAY